jgi:hypothetical protein
VLLAAGFEHGSSALSEDPALAPDGRPGFGTKRSGHALGRVFSSPSQEEGELLTGLDELTSDILVLREMVRRDYRARGYMDILEQAGADDLRDLHRRFRELEPSATSVLGEGGRGRDVFLELLLDLRFQIRVELFERFDDEGRELRAGLALLRGTQDGLFELKDGEARSIAARLDLAASILRAVRLDLDALRERGDDAAPGAPEPSWMAELIGITKLRSEQDRLSALDALRAKAGRRLERLKGVLFWPRLQLKIATELAKREALEDLAAQHLERTLRYLLIPPFDKDPQRQIREMSRAERHRYALSEGLRGLAADPLNEELTYWTGIATDFLYEPREGRLWFDRYLALRGIRAHEHRSTKDRELTDKESYALEKVLQAYTLPGGLPGR